MDTPFTDLVTFLTASTGDFNSLGAWRWLVLLIFYALLAGSLWFAVTNWREDSSERNGRALTLFVMRILIGCMWFQGMLWKLPLGQQNGLYFWTQQMEGRAAFEVHRKLVTDVILPNFAIFNPLVFLAEFGFASALILGLFVRLAGVGAALFALTLWIGIYNQRQGDPAEWSWSYVFLAMLCALFAVFAAGRALGADAWLRRHVEAVRAGRGWGALARVFG